MVATFLHFGSLYYLVATLPLYVLALGGSVFQTGLIWGMFSTSSLLARPLFGAWIDRAGRKPFLVAGSAIYVVASLGYVLIRSVPGLLCWRVFHAMGLCTFSTAAASALGDLAPPKRRGTTISYYGLAQAGALTVGPWIGTATQHALGYSGLFAATALTAFAALVCALAVDLPAKPAVSRSSTARPGAAAPLRSCLRLPVAVQFAASIAYGTVLSFAAVVAHERALGVEGAVFAVVALSSFGVRLVAGRAYDAWGPRAVLMPSFIGLALGMAALAVTTEALPFLGSALLAGAGIGGAHSALLACAVERAPAEARGSAVAIFTSCWELGVGGGTTAMGRLAEITGFTGMYLAAAGVSLCGLAALPLLAGPPVKGSETVSEDRVPESRTGLGRLSGHVHAGIRGTTRVFAALARGVRAEPSETEDRRCRSTKSRDA